MFQTEHAKIAYLISHLTGRAEAWVTEKWARRSVICHFSYSSFSQTFSQIFHTVSSGHEAARSLISLHQERHTVTDYALEFHTLVADSDCNNSALMDAFLRGLSHKIKDQLIPLNIPKNLDSVIALTHKLDIRIQDRERERINAFL